VVGVAGLVRAGRFEQRRKDSLKARNLMEQPIKEEHNISGFKKIEP
jgi:hypothetical protein